MSIQEACLHEASVVLAKMDGGRQVWAPHPVQGFVLGTIIDLGNDSLTIRPAAAGGEVSPDDQQRVQASFFVYRLCHLQPITATYDRVFPAIDETVKAVEDNCKLTTLHVCGHSESRPWQLESNLFLAAIL